MKQPVFLYAALCGLMLVGLSVYVISARTSMRIGIGDGGNPALLRRIRIHANFIEYVPTALLLIYLVQQAGTSAWIVHVLGVCLVIARVLHIWGLAGSTGVSPGRFAGIALTFAVILAAALLLLPAAAGIHF